MAPEIIVPPVHASDTLDKPIESKLDPVSQNIETILGFYTREEQKISRSQHMLENASSFLGQPLFLGLILLFVALWAVANLFPVQTGLAVFDPSPFHALQGIVGLGALLMATIVLIKQNRLAKLEEQWRHLELQVNLLTEQKATKLINLIEELRRDLPMVKNREDAEAIGLQQPTDPEVVLAALDEQLETVERLRKKGDVEGNVKERILQP